MALTVSFWPARDFRNAAIRSLIWKKQVCPVPSAAGRSLSARRRKAAGITAVRLHRNVISCPGRSLPKKNVLNAAAFCWRREASWYVPGRAAVMCVLPRKRKKKLSIERIHPAPFGRMCMSAAVQPRHSQNRAYCALHQRIAELLYNSLIKREIGLAYSEIA